MDCVYRSVAMNWAYYYSEQYDDLSQEGGGGGGGSPQYSLTLLSCITIKRK